VNEGQLNDFKRKISAMNVPFEELGTVTAGMLSIDGESWGTISDWKHKYDNAIGNMLANQESEQALATL
jgi:phosphoribosylformylglycinamidine synthase